MKRASMLVLALLWAACSNGPGRSRVGGPCTTTADCTAGPSTPECVTQSEAAANGYSAPGGYCTATACNLTNPTTSCGAGAICLALPGSGVAGCYQLCPSDHCRSGYECDDEICRPTATCALAGAACSESFTCCNGLPCVRGTCTGFDGGTVDLRASSADMHVPTDGGHVVGDGGDCCVADCATLSCVDECNRGSCTGCDVNSCTTQGTQSVQGTEDITQESIQNVQENIQNTQESIQNVQDTQESIQNVQDTQESIQNTENTQNTEDTQNTQDTEDTQSTECFDCFVKKKGAHKKPRPVAHPWWKLWQ